MGGNHFSQCRAHHPTERSVGLNDYHYCSCILSVTAVQEYLYNVFGLRPAYLIPIRRFHLVYRYPVFKRAVVSSRSEKRGGLGERERERESREGRGEERERGEERHTDGQTDNRKKVDRSVQNYTHKINQRHVYNLNIRKSPTVLR